MKRKDISMKQHHHNINNNLKQLTKKSLIIGVDISKAFHVARAVDYRGMELARTFSFTSNSKGFRDFHDFIRKISTAYDKADVIVGLEPTGPYGDTFIQFLSSKDIRVVLVLGSTVSKAKELDDNTPSKNDYKDALLIAGLVRDGRFLTHREFSPLVHELKEAMGYSYQLTKNSTRIKCQIDNWLCKYFPEFSFVFKDWTKKTAYATLSVFPMPKMIIGRTEESIVKTWREQGVIKGVGLKKAHMLKFYAKRSTGLKYAQEAAEMHIRALIDQYEQTLIQQEEVWLLIENIVKDVPLYETICQIPGMGKKAACGIVAEIGDITVFSHPRQLIRLAGLSLKESSSGGRRGTSEITRRGRPLLRHYLYIAVLGIIKTKDNPFWDMHQYHTKYKQFPLRPMQSVVALMCKLLRIIYGMSKSGKPYDPALVTAGITGMAGFIDMEDF